MDYYTLQIHYGNSQNPTIEERKDLEPNGDAKTWMNAIGKKIFSSGFVKEHTPISFECVSPFLIHKVFLIKQDRKFNV